MKKIHIILYVLVAGLLVVSCGKSRKPEVKEAAKAAANGLFGSVGEDMIYLMDDFDLQKEKYNQKNEELKEKFMQATESKVAKLMEEGKELEEDNKREKEELKEQFKKLVEKIKGEEVPTEIIGDTPLKLICPFIVIGSGKSGSGIEFEAKVELTADRPALSALEQYHSEKITPKISFVDNDGNILYKVPLIYSKGITKYGSSLKVGFNDKISFSLYKNAKEFPKALAAKKIIIRWDKPYSNASQSNAVTTHEEPVDEGMDDYDDQFDGVGQEGLLGSIPEGTTVYEGDMAGFPIVFTIIRNDNEGVLKAIYKNVKYGATMNLIGESLPAMGGDISFLGSTNDGDWSFDLTGNAELITGTASGNGKNLKVRLRRKK